jgi:hypothetical protein
MIIDPERGDQRRSLAKHARIGPVLLLSLLGLAACSDWTNYARDGRSINIRDCSEWRTESVSGCYDGQGGGGGKL